MCVLCVSEWWSSAITTSSDMKSGERMKKKETQDTIFVIVLEHLWFGVYCLLKHKIAGTKAGVNFHCPYFPCTHLPCNGSTIYNSARREALKGTGPFYTSHLLAAQRDFSKPLYVPVAGGYGWKEQLPGLTVIMSWEGQRRKRAIPQKALVKVFIIQPHFSRSSSP